MSKFIDQVMQMVLECFCLLFYCSPEHFVDVMFLAEVFCLH